MTSRPVLAAEKTSPRHDAATTMLHCWDAIGQVMGSAQLPLEITLDNRADNRAEAKQFNHGLIKPETFVSHSLRVLRVLLANSKQAFLCLLLRRGFRSATLP